jgi:leader peptidase (prepilin peptidase)/N-methyltransferase
LYWQLGPGLRLAIGTLYACLFVLIFVIDLERHLVLNKVIYPSILAAPFLAWGWGLDPRHALIGGAVAFGALLLLAVVYPAGMGMGDVKLAAFVGLITAWPDVVVALFMTIMSGGIVAVALILTRLRGRKDPIAYATFLVIGATIALTWGEQIRHWYWG